MNPEIKARWVAALRSGQYTQGRSHLRIVDLESHDNYAYCCLGVLTDLAVQDGIGYWDPDDLILVEEGSESTVAHRVGDAIEDSLLPPAVAQWAGFSQVVAERGTPEVKDATGEYLALYVLNDGTENDFDTPREPLPFEELADLIEGQL